MVGLLLGIALLGVLAWPSSQVQALEPVPPVWGRKPVLAYFLLTPSLAQELQREVRLTPAQFAALTQIAVVEDRELGGLRLTTDQIADNPQLSVLEKRDAIARSGYNVAVNARVIESQAQVQAALDADTYARLVKWIEARWTLERGLRRQPVSIDAAGNRSYSIYATHFDTNGAYKVALPDKCLKFSNGGSSICSGSGYPANSTFTAKLEYTSSVNLTAFDSGPWNVDDNFFATLDDPQPRRLFTDLPLGMPAAQAAYFDDYNSGLDQFDRTVTAPFALDIGDGVGDDIGLPKGNNDWVTVTFKWTDTWDDYNGDVVSLLQPTTLTPAYTGDMCVTAWHRIFPNLSEDGEAAYLTLNVDDPFQSTNSAEWRPNIPSAGEYLVRAFIPDHGPIDWLCPAVTINSDTGDAEYVVHHGNGQTTVSRNQAPMANQYLDLGTYEFNAGTSGRVVLSDLNDEDNLSRTIAFSALIFREVLPPATATASPTPSASPTPTLTPTPTSTPTATPLPYLQAGFALAPPASVITIPIKTGYLQPPGLGDAVVDVQFDPAVIDAVNCQADPDGVFDSASCLPDFENDGSDPDSARISVSSSGGIVGDALLANLSFQLMGTSGALSPLSLFPIEFDAVGALGLPVDIVNGFVCILPCPGVFFLPFVVQNTNAP